MSVFVVGPQGVRHGSVGDVVMAEYRITQVTPQQVQLKHLSSNKELTLPVPAAR